MAAQVDPGRRLRDARDQRVDELVVAPDERVDGAMVVGIRVDVEHTHAVPAAEGVADRAHDFRVAALGDVRHGFERKLHAPSLGRPSIRSR